MKFETFRGPTMAAVMSAARTALGEDVLVVRSGRFRQGPLEGVEVVATDPAAMEALLRRLDAPVPPLPRAGARPDGLPFRLALVGPPGAGKTTTATKLAIHPDVFGAHRVGFMTLDTFRAGAVEQLDCYAAVTEMPMEVVYEADDVPQALARLAGCDIVIIDTPGRSPLSRAQNQRWRALLAATRPDETHLVLPASLRPDVARLVADSFEGCGVTHMLVSKLDECPNGAGLLDLVAELDLRARWIASGQEVPYDLKPARSSLPAALSMSR